MIWRFLCRRFLFWTNRSNNPLVGDPERARLALRLDRGKGRNVEDGELSSGPKRALVGRPPAENVDPPESESRYGQAYYSMDAVQRSEAASQRPSGKPRRRGKRSLFLFLAVLGCSAYLYWHPGALDPAINAFRGLITGLRSQVFSEGTGYGTLSTGEDDDSYRVVPPSR